jgi:hypothetical protein
MGLLRSTKDCNARRRRRRRKRRSTALLQAMKEITKW